MAKNFTNKKGWFKFYPHHINSEPVKNISNGAFRLWITLLCDASQNNGQIKIDDHFFNSKGRKTNFYFDELLRNNLIKEINDAPPIFVPDIFVKKPYKSNTSAERMRRYRARLKTKKMMDISHGKAPSDDEKNADVCSKIERSKYKHVTSHVENLSCNASHPLHVTHHFVEDNSNKNLYETSTYDDCNVLNFVETGLKNVASQRNALHPLHVTRYTSECNAENRNHFVDNFNDKSVSSSLKNPVESSGFGKDSIIIEPVDSKSEFEHVTSQRQKVTCNALQVTCNANFGKKVTSLTDSDSVTCPDKKRQKNHLKSMSSAERVRKFRAKKKEGKIKKVTSQALHPLHPKKSFYELLYEYSNNNIYNNKIKNIKKNIYFFNCFNNKSAREEVEQILTYFFGMHFAIQHMADERTLSMLVMWHQAGVTAADAIRAMDNARDYVKSKNGCITVPWYFKDAPFINNNKDGVRYVSAAERYEQLLKARDEFVKQYSSPDDPQFDEDPF